MTVFLSTENPGGGAEALWSDPVFLIKGPPTADGQEVYYRTRALERYVVPATEVPAGFQSATEYFNGQSAGQVYLAVQVDTILEAVVPALAQTDSPPQQN